MSFICGIIFSVRGATFLRRSAKQYALLLLLALSSTFPTSHAVRASDDRIADALSHLVVQDFQSALPKLQVLAQEGNSFAQGLLGKMFAHGEGTAVDYSIAVKWLTRAAEQKSREAIMELVTIHRGGLGTPMNMKAALYWAERATELNVPEAYRIMGELMLEQESGPENYTAAVAWFRRGADTFDAESMFALGFCYTAGLGVDQDYLEAYKWYDLARRAALEPLYINAFVNARERLMPYQVEKAGRAADDWVLSHDWKRQGKLAD